MPAGKSVHSQGVGAALSEIPKDYKKTAWCESFTTYGPCATMLKDITLCFLLYVPRNTQMLPGFHPQRAAVLAQTPACGPTKQ